MTDRMIGVLVTNTISEYVHNNDDVRECTLPVYSYATAHMSVVTERADVRMSIS